MPLTLADMSSRTKPMAKRKWVSKAIPESHKGAFKAKAEAAGKTTREFAREKADAPGKLGKEARLASTLMGMNKERRKALYDHPRSRKDD
jgi:hypothetical protein